MSTYIVCTADGTILITERGETLPPELVIQENVPEGGFYIDLTGQEPFDTMDIMDINTNYKVDPKKKKLVKIEKE